MKQRQKSGMHFASAVIVALAISSACPHVVAREVKCDLGLEMQPDEKIAWMQDAKLGMFIHWGLYAGPGKGEWYMENDGVSPEEYRRLAQPESGERYFAADAFDADEWMRVAKSGGFRYVCLTTQHHDGYALFASAHTNAFTSVQTHGRDFVAEYVKAARAAGLRVGLYKTLINWRYPGYYDITGTNCAPNKFGYTTAAWHRENARLMKEELYCQTRELMSNYGKIDYLFWDGGWLAQRGSDSDAAFFWESGKFSSPDSEWPVGERYAMTDEETGRPLGLMGMVRKLQPDLVCNLRSGWCGDFTCEEGPREVKGPIREGLVEKCLSIAPRWGYTKASEDRSRIMPLGRLQRYTADCIVRGMCLIVNVSPDRHGVIPKAERDRIAEYGEWVDSVAPAVYSSRPGPWQPKDGEFGFSTRDGRVYVWLLDGFKDDSLECGALPHGMTPVSARELGSGREVGLSSKDGTLVLTGLSVLGGGVRVVEVSPGPGVDAP